MCPVLGQSNTHTDSTAIQCRLCPNISKSTDDFSGHIESHFTSGRCQICDQQLILIDGKLYILQLHEILNCNKENIVDFNLRGKRTAIGTIKKEIDESAAENEENDADYVPAFDDIPSSDDEYQLNDTKLKRDQSESDGEDIDSDSDVLPFEMVECVGVKGENDSTKKSEEKIVRPPPSAASAVDESELPSNRIYVKPHTGEKQIREHMCKICGKFFLTMLTLKKHIKLMSTHKKKAHVWCGEQSTSTTAILNEEDVKTIPVEQISVNPKGEKYLRRFKCKTCGKYYLNKRTLTNHQLHVHQFIKRPIYKDKLTPISDEECRKLPSERVMITSTGEKYLRKYKCSQCDKYLISKSSLGAHTRNAHPRDGVARKEPEYPCDICGKVLKSKGGLNVHKEIHSDTRRFICSYCGKAFKTKSHLDGHTNMHTGLKPYKCKVCDKAFGKSSQLNVHMRIHTGDKPYKCRIEGCERAYAHTIDLKRHLYGAHRIYTKKFECSICLRIFPENKLLTKHLQSHGLGNSDR